MLSYTEIESIINDASNNVTMTLDSVAAVQIVTWGTNQWVSFDNAETFALKTSYVNSECLGGYGFLLKYRLENKKLTGDYSTMVWAVSQDNNGDAIGTSSLY